MLAQDKAGRAPPGPAGSPARAARARGNDRHGRHHGKRRPPRNWWLWDRRRDGDRRRRHRRNDRDGWRRNRWHDRHRRNPHRWHHRHRWNGRRRRRHRRDPHRWHDRHRRRSDGWDDRHRRDAHGWHHRHRWNGNRRDRHGRHGRPVGPAPAAAGQGGLQLRQRAQRRLGQLRQRRPQPEPRHVQYDLQEHVRRGRPRRTVVVSHQRQRDAGLRQRRKGQQVPQSHIDGVKAILDAGASSGRAIVISLWSFDMLQDERRHRAHQQPAPAGRRRQSDRPTSTTTSRRW